MGGVAAGLAAHLGVPVLWVRCFFVATAFLGGFGLMLYAGLWVFLPADQRFEVSAPGLESATRTGRRPGRRSRLRDAGPAIALGALFFGVVLGFEGIFGQGVLFWPVVLGIAGIALLWRQADEAQRERWVDTSGRIDPFRAVFGNGGWAAYGRIAAGLGLIVTALTVFAVVAGKATFAVPVLVAGLLGLLGLAIVVGPWAVRLINDLGAERAERVRTQERADMAAHLHDSVLQTLALIQRNSADATTVARLARSQERDLRQWLFEADTADATTLAGALKEMAADVESQHAVVVDVVTVGDCPLDEELRPVVHAAREAVVNVAKHAGTQRADVFAETSPERWTSSSATVARASRSVRSRPTVRASAPASWTGWPVTAVGRTYARLPARAPRSDCTCRARTTRPRTRRADEPAHRPRRRPRAGGPGRRPCDVPRGSARRARRERRRAGGGRR